MNRMMINAEVLYCLDGHPLRTWCYGHYHYHHAEEHEDVVFRLLDMCYNGSIYDMVEVR